MLGPLADGEDFTQADFALLEKYNFQKSIGKIHEKVKKMNVDMLE